LTQEKPEAYMKDVSTKGSQLKKYTNMSTCFSCHGEKVTGPGTKALGYSTAGKPK
jgi:cytochrome c553